MDTTPAEPHSAVEDEPSGYEPPQLWEYGSLRLDTAGFGGHGTDNGINKSYT